MVKIPQPLCSFCFLLKFIASHKIPSRKNIGPTKYPQEIILNPRNTQEKKLWTHEIPTRKNFGSTKYPWEKFWTHETPTKARRHCGTRPTMARDPRNLAHSILPISVDFLLWIFLKRCSPSQAETFAKWLLAAVRFSSIFSCSFAASDSLVPQERSTIFV